MIPFCKRTCIEGRGTDAVTKTTAGDSLVSHLKRPADRGSECMIDISEGNSERTIETVLLESGG